MNALSAIFYFFVAITGINPVKVFHLNGAVGVTEFEVRSPSSIETIGIIKIAGHADCRFMGYKFQRFFIDFKNEGSHSGSEINYIVSGNRAQKCVIVAGVDSSGYLQVYFSPAQQGETAVISNIEPNLQRHGFAVFSDKATVNRNKVRAITPHSDLQRLCSDSVGVIGLCKSPDQSDEISEAEYKPNPRRGYAPFCNIGGPLSGICRLPLGFQVGIFAVGAFFFAYIGACGLGRISDNSDWKRRLEGALILVGAFSAGSYWLWWATFGALPS